MPKKPTYEELEQRVEELARQAQDHECVEEELLKLSYAVEQSPSAIMITDADGVIEYVNPKFAEITGYSREEILGTNAADLGKQTAEEREKMWETISAGGEWRGEFHNRKRNGESYWERASISALRNKDDLITHYVKVSEDITALKQAQEALRESEKRLYEQKRRTEILRFANDMALKLMHELRNPLVSIGGFSRRISIRDYHDDKLKEYTTIIFEQAKRLDSALSKVLVQLQAAAEQ